MCFNKLITLFIIFIMLVNPVLAADTGLQKEKVIDGTKEKETKITNKDKSITGDIKVTTKDVSKFSVKKKSNYEISISKSGEHAKAKVSFPKSELQKIDIDGDGKFGLLHISDNGEVTHTTATEAELVAGKVMTFSTNIVNGYSGYKEYTFSDVESGDILNIDDVSGNYTLSAAVGGVVPAYTAGIPTSGLLAHVKITNNYTDTSGYAKTPTVYNGALVPDRFGNANGAVSFNGANNKIQFPSITGAKSIVIDINMNSAQNTYWYLIDCRSGLSNGHVSSSGKGTNITNIYNINNVISYSAIPKNTWTTLTINASTLFTDDITIGAKYNGWESIKAIFDNIRIYNHPLSSSEMLQNYAGGSGISFQPEPSYNWTGYNVASGVEKVLNTDSTCTGIEYVDTTGGTHDVTVTVYFTEDTTLISDSHDTDSHNVNFVHTSTYNAENGSMTYEKLGGYDRTATFTSNNTNATIVQNLTHFTLYTGTLQAGDSYYYNVSVPWKLEKTIFAGNWCKWTGTGWAFLNSTPTNNSASLVGQLEVTVS